MILTQDEYVKVRSGSKTGHLMPANRTLALDTLRRLYRRYEHHDADGASLGYVTEAATDSETPVVITIMALEVVDVMALVAPARKTDPRMLGVPDAKCCGYRTVTGLREWWVGKHPRSPLARLVRFQVGDVRDRDRFLQRYVSQGGDYTFSHSRAIDELPALSPAELAAHARAGRQHYVARAKSTESVLARESYAQRIARIEAAGTEAVRAVQGEFAIIGQRLHYYEQALERAG